MSNSAGLCSWWSEVRVVWLDHPHRHRKPTHLVRTMSMLKPSDACLRIMGRRTPCCKTGLTKTLWAPPMPAGTSTSGLRRGSQSLNGQGQAILQTKNGYPRLISLERSLIHPVTLTSSHAAQKLPELQPEGESCSKKLDGLDCKPHEVRRVSRNRQSKSNKSRKHLSFGRPA